MIANVVSIVLQSLGLTSKVVLVPISFLADVICYKQVLIQLLVVATASAAFLGIEELLVSG